MTKADAVCTLPVQDGPTSWIGVLRAILSIRTGTYNLNCTGMVADSSTMKDGGFATGASNHAPPEGVGHNSPRDTATTGTVSSNKLELAMHGSNKPSATLLLLGETVHGGPPAEVTMKSIVAVGLVESIPVFRQLDEPLANRICMLDVRFLDSKEQRLCVRSLSLRVSVNGRPVGDKWQPLYEGDAVGFGHTDGAEHDTRTVYAVTYEQQDTKRRQESIAVAFARDRLAEYSIELPLDAVEEAGVAALLSNSPVNGEPWPRRAQRAHNELLAVGSVARAIFDSGRQHFMECAKDEARARGVSFGARTEEALDRVGRAIARFYEASGFTVPPDMFWAIEGILKCNDALQREQLHVGDMELAASMLHELVVSSISAAEQPLDVGMVDRIVLQLVEEFDQERMLDPETELQALIARVWDDFGQAKVRTFFPGTEQWTRFHVDVRASLTTLSKGSHFARNLQSAINSLAESRGDHWALDILNHALSLALVKNNAAAIQVALRALHARKEVDMGTFRVWLLEARRHPDWAFMEEVIMQPGFMGGGGGKETDAAVIDFVSYMRCMEPGLPPQMALGDAQKADLEDQDKSASEDEGVDSDGEDGRTSEDEAMSDAQLTMALMSSLGGLEEDDEAESRSACDVDYGGGRSRSRGSGALEEPCGEGERSPAADVAAAASPEPRAEAARPQSPPSEEEQRPGARAGAWHWLAARGAELSGPGAAAAARNEVAQALGIEDDGKRFCLRWRQDLVFDDCPPLLGFRSLAEAKRAASEPKLGGLGLVRCGERCGSTAVAAAPCRRSPRAARASPVPSGRVEPRAEAGGATLGASSSPRVLGQGGVPRAGHAGGSRREDAQSGDESVPRQWLVAAAPDLPARLAKPGGLEELRRQVAQVLAIEDNEESFSVHWEHALVFDDCPPLLSFRRAEDADRAPFEQALEGLALAHCAEPPPARLVSVPRSWPEERSRSRDRSPGAGQARGGRTRVVLQLCEPSRDPHAAVDRDGIVVLYKPAFWTVTTSDGGQDDWPDVARGGPRIQVWLRQKLGKQYPFLCENPRAGLVHRLDVQTSGPILVGTEEQSFLEMRDNLRKHLWYKEYLALMHGAVPPKRCCGVLDYKLFTKQDRGLGWRTEVNNRKGEYAVTRYEAVEAYRCRDVHKGSTQRYTLIRVQLITGRTHQIRVHLQEFARDLGLPIRGIVGDYKYLPQEQVRCDRRLCARVFLHAHQLHFPLPRKHRTILRVKCPLPPELQRALGKLERDERTTEQFRALNRRDSVLQPLDSGSWGFGADLRAAPSAGSPGKEGLTNGKGHRAPLGGRGGANEGGAEGGGGGGPKGGGGGRGRDGAAEGGGGGDGGGEGPGDRRGLQQGGSSRKRRRVEQAE